MQHPTPLQLRVPGVQNPVPRAVPAHVRARDLEGVHGQDRADVAEELQVPHLPDPPEREPGAAALLLPPGPRHGGVVLRVMRRVLLGGLVWGLEAFDILTVLLMGGVWWGEREFSGPWLMDCLV